MPSKINTKIIPYRRLRKFSGWQKWISATATRNYLLKDPIIDWFKFHGRQTMKDPILQTEATRIFNKNHNNNSYQFIPFIKKQGIKFEDKLIQLIKRRLGPAAIIDIGASHETCRSEEYVHNTFEAMKKGIAVIYSGVVWNPSNKTYGVPDLLVRSDMFGKLVTYDPIPFEERFKRAPFISADIPYHYRVVDIKFSTLQLCADGIHLLNQGSMPAYKSQLYIYNQALAKMQGYNPQKAYILGSKWKYTRRDEIFSGRNCLTKLGTIDFQKMDFPYINRTKEALKWITHVKRDGKRWNPLKPNRRFEMYPNMCNNKDYPFREIKQKIANEISEITSVWMVGIKHRKHAYNKKVYKWTDTQCTTSLLGIKGIKTKPIIDKMLAINRDASSLPVNPQTIQCKTNNWHIKASNEVELFIDFESVNDIITDFSTLPHIDELSMIFVIGVGYEDPVSGIWRYKRFVADLLDPDSEKKICNDFMNFVSSFNSKLVKMFHWAQAEQILWEQAMIRHSLSYIKGDFIDMLQIFKEEPIIIKGCLNFSIKTIAKQLYSMGLISSIWTEEECGECTNGANAMIAALMASDEAKKKNITMINTIPMQNIVAYNEIDCKVLYEIVRYLRTNHI